MSLYSTVFRTVLRTQAFLYEHTDGLIGHRLLGVPSLMLRTTGRKSGQVRTNSLSYARDGERWLVVASKGGADQAPGWLYNLRANPSVEVQVGRKRTQATATVIEHDNADYARVWKIVNDNNAGRYDAYQKLTSRPIPVVALTPSGADQQS
jgi:F420H(2)-dependent quinone reductase